MTVAVFLFPFFIGKFEHIPVVTIDGEFCAIDAARSCVAEDAERIAFRWRDDVNGRFFQRGGRILLIVLFHVGRDDTASGAGDRVGIVYERVAFRGRAGAVHESMAFPCHFDPEGVFRHVLIVEIIIFFQGEQFLEEIPGENQRWTTGRGDVIISKEGVAVHTYQKGGNMGGIRHARQDRQVFVKVGQFSEISVEVVVVIIDFGKQIIVVYMGSHGIKYIVSLPPVGMEGELQSSGFNMFLPFRLKGSAEFVFTDAFDRHRQIIAGIKGEEPGDLKGSQVWSLVRGETE